MVKLQKPLPKKFKQKAKIDNPIKKQKDELKKDKTKSATKNISKELVAESFPAKKAPAVRKPVNNVTEKPLKGKKADKKPGNKQIVANVPAPAAPKVKEVKTNGSVEVKAAKKQNQPKQNGSETKPAAPLKIKAEKVTKAIPVKVEKDVEVKPPTKPQKATQKAAPIAKLVVPKVEESIPQKALLVPPKVKKEKKKNGKVSAEATKPLVAKEPPASITSVVKNEESLAQKALLVPPKAAKGKKIPKFNEKKIAKLNEKKMAKLAALKEKLQTSSGEDEEEGNGDEKTKIKRKKKLIRYEPFPYDEEKFDSIVNVENVKKIVDALNTLVQKEVQNKKKGIFEDFRYMLQVGCFKVPSCPKRMVKLFLRHPMVEKGDDVLFIVPDLQRGGKVDYEPTKQHYEDLLRPHGLDWITVMPMNQLRKECVTFEQKRRLCASYDHFLCDGRIVSHVVGLIGKLTQRARMTLHSVRITDKRSLKQTIEGALCKTAYRQLCKSTLYTIPLATHRFTSQQVAENVIKVVAKLKRIFPGGMGNVRNLYMKIDIIGTSALPLYVSMAKPPEETPYVVGPREKRMLQLKQEANEVLSKFNMNKEGTLSKLTKAGVEKKRKLTEMKAALKEQGDQPKAKNAKKAEQTEEEVTEVKANSAKKASTDSKNKQKQKKDEVKELELPEEEDETSDEDDDDEVHLAGSSDEEESEDMGQADQEEDDDQESLEAESDMEILENGLADEESDDEDEEDANTSDAEDDDDEEGDDDDDGDEDDEEEDEESS